MKNLGLILIVASVMGLVLPVAAIAQDDDGGTIIFGMYYRCNQGKESRADEIYNQFAAPIAQKHVDLGHVSATLWLEHNQGGPWRRLWAILGTDMDQMMDMRAAIVSEIAEKHPAEMAELGEVCPGHDDYIWTEVTASSASNAGALGSASMSAYHSCDASREGRADQIFTELFAPLYKKHQDMGHLATWGFYSHRMGGIFRRLETMSGADHKTLMKMQGAIYQEAFEKDPFATNEFREICTWHSDYMWTNGAE